MCLMGGRAEDLDLWVCVRLCSWGRVLQAGGDLWGGGGRLQRQGEGERKVEGGKGKVRQGKGEERKDKGGLGKAKREGKKGLYILCVHIRPGLDARKTRCFNVFLQLNIRAGGHKVMPGAMCHDATPTQE